MLLLHLAHQSLNAWVSSSEAPEESKTVFHWGVRVVLVKKILFVSHQEEEAATEMFTL